MGRRRRRRMAVWLRRPGVLEALQAAAGVGVAAAGVGWWAGEPGAGLLVVGVALVGDYVAGRW